MSAEQASSSVGPDTEIVASASSEAGSAKSGKRRRRLGPARARAKAQTRQALLDAAERLFIQEGFDQPGLDVICSVAGRTRGAYNVHFGSRDQLVAAVALRSLEAFEAELTGGGPLSLVPAVASRATDSERPAQESDEPRQRLPMPLILHAAARIPSVRDEVLAVFDRIRRSLGETIAQKHTASELRFDAAPGAVAPVLLALWVGLELLEATGPQRLDLDRRELSELLETLLES